MVGPDLPGGSGFWGRVAGASQEGRVPLGRVAGTSQEGPVPWAMVPELPSWAVGPQPPRRVRLPGPWAVGPEPLRRLRRLRDGAGSFPGGGSGSLGRVVALGWLRIYEGAAFSWDFSEFRVRGVAKSRGPYGQGSGTQLRGSGGDLILGPTLKERCQFCMEHLKVCLEVRFMFLSRTMCVFSNNNFNESI